MVRTFLACLIFLLGVSAVAQQMTKDERKNVQRYTKELKSKDDSERYEAAEHLRYYKYPEVVTLLSQTLKDESVRVRNRAALSLFEMKEVARPAIPALLEALKDEDAYVRINAGATLLNLDVPEEQVIPAIRELLTHPQPRIQVAAVRFLQGDVSFLELMPVLTSALKNSDVSIREEAAKEFDEPDTLPAEALPILVSALNDPHAKVRAYAASALDKYKTNGTAALPALIRVLKDSDRDVRFEAIDAIESMGTWATDALPALQEVLRKDPDPGIRRAALGALEEVDPEGRTVVPVLIEALNDRDPEVREAVLNTMLSLRPFPHQAVPAVQNALSTEQDERVKRSLQTVVERGEQERNSKSGLTKPSAAPGIPKPVKGAMSKEEATRILQEQGVQMTTDEFWHRMHEGDGTVVKAMLSAGFPPNTVLQGMSALLLATRVYDDDPAKKEIMKALVDFGADVNYKDDIDTTPFFWAAGICDSELLSSMIKAGATLEVKANGGATTLSQAVMANCPENVRLLLKSGYKLKNEPPWLLTTAKNPEIAALLRKAGVR